MAKVVRGDDMFFKDDIKIIDAEIATQIAMPQDFPILLRDELQVLYNGHVFVASKDATPDALIKIYTVSLGLKEIESPKAQEDEYFSRNSALFDKLKADFIERAVNGISIPDGQTKGTINSQISSELIKRITQEYSKQVPAASYSSPHGKGSVARLDDRSVFNSCMNGCEKIILLDSKVHELTTISDYVSQFKNSFEKKFYAEAQKACGSATPEEIYKLLTDNADKVHRKALPLVRNKIWHSKRSFKLLLDGTYWMPEPKMSRTDLISAYQKLLERKVKIDAAKEYF